MKTCALAEVRAPEPVKLAVPAGDAVDVEVSDPLPRSESVWVSVAVLTNESAPEPERERVLANDNDEV